MSSEETQKSITLSVKENIESLTAECILDEETIYTKNFELNTDNDWKMYPCEENGDGKALYWYGMELTEMNIGKMYYNTSLAFELGTVTKNDNSFQMYYNDTSSSKAYGIGINYYEDLTTYNTIEVNVKNIDFSSNGCKIFMINVCDRPNNYYLRTVDHYEEDEGNKHTLCAGLKTLNISAISGEMYVNLLNYNPSGIAATHLSTCSVDIDKIVLTI